MARTDGAGLGGWQWGHETQTRPLFWRPPHAADRPLNVELDEVGEKKMNPVVYKVCMPLNSSVCLSQLLSACLNYCLPVSTTGPQLFALNCLPST